ncbi:lysophospholipase [Shimia sp. CNT1-13L.2]|uniref:alpha/beta hydrolase n=1 Tax=Shimia sp. CNT1-13L.2 TaxID=2959663 RepID=UPI0020CFE76C|nr:alpha/beta fold hydrolase [Shimia sp. CNT1-13L.2]MCP9481854.1 lysophospholipase [Shimia sp. CNT1-13L.2]
MRTFGRFLGRVLLALVVLGLGAWFLVPREHISVVPTFDETSIGPDVDTYLASREMPFSDLTAGVQKRVVWHGAAGDVTPVSIVYVHGFSATSEEIRPVPDRVAERLGANLVYTRLQGHGRPGAALAEATAQGWMNDFAEAVEIGRRVGERVVVMATSTGGTLAAEAALQDALMEDVAGIIFVSPNFAIGDPAAAVLTMPGARDVAGAWGAPAEVSSVTVGAGDDPNAHVIAGDIMSPGMNDLSIEGFIIWINGL